MSRWRIIVAAALFVGALALVWLARLRYGAGAVGWWWAR